VAEQAIEGTMTRPASSRPSRDRMSMAFGATVLATLLASSAFAPILAPHDPHAQSLHANLEAPTSAHPLGRDKLGRDQLSRIIYGARVSLEVGFLTVLISLTLGVVVGAFAGFFGGAVDFAIMRAVDILLAFPGILLAIAMSAVLGPGIENVVIALSLVGWTGYARLVRGEVLSIRKQDHVEAARALGAGGSRILVRHILPLLAAPLVVQATFGVAGAIVAEASRLGVQPPTPSWGAMVNDGRSYLLIAPGLVLYPGIAIFVTVLGLNSLGDGLRERLDVRSR
jgi:peptide/nickel transport system permease protein